MQGYYALFSRRRVTAWDEDSELGPWRFDGFTEHEEKVTEHEETEAEAGGRAAHVDLSDYDNPRPA
jgi:hypothetical protein